MIHLISFSLKRRFKNKMTLMLVIILSVVMLFAGFSDLFVEALMPELFDPIKVKVNLDLPKLFESNNKIEIDESATTEIVLTNNVYEIRTRYPLNLDDEIIIHQAINHYHMNKQLLHSTIEEMNVIEQFQDIQIETIITDETSQSDHGILFVLITAIYFMMIGFAAMIAQEIVGEKTTKVLEVIAMAVGLKVHYYSKIVIGWLSVLLQVLMSGVIIAIVMGMRYLYDDGVGLLAFLNKANVISIDQKTFTELVKLAFDNKDLLGLLLISLAFLFIGILFIQMILVVLTIHVQTLEEAGSIQSPFYIVLLILYYVCMFLNNPDSMTKGFGLILSFIPVASMIFMPSRILMYSPSNMAIVVSLIVSLISLIILIRWGEKRYVSSVLDYTKPVKN